MEGLAYLFAAYTAVWVVLFAYLFGLSRRQRRLNRELELLKKRVESEGMLEE